VKKKKSGETRKESLSSFISILFKGGKVGPGFLTIGNRERVLSLERHTDRERNLGVAKKKGTVLTA